MSLLYLFLASLCEAIWVMSLRFSLPPESQSPESPLPQAIVVFPLTILMMLLSVYLLHKSALTLGLVFAYSVWVALGLVMLILLENMLYQHPFNAKHILGCLLLAVGAMLLKSHH